MELYRKAKKEGWDKETFLKESLSIEGVYVPAFYDVTYNEDGTVQAITAKNRSPNR